MKRAIAFLFAIAMLSMLANASTVTRTFTNYYGSPPLGYVTTDLEANPSITAPDYACVGTSVTPTLQVQTDWYSSVYDAKLKSNANLVSCLTPSSAVNQNQPISWLSSYSYNCAFGPGTQTYFSDYTAFALFMSGCGISSTPESIEKSNYYDSSGSVYPGLFKAGIGTYCNGTVSVNSTGAYGFGPAQYMGNAPSLPPLTASSPTDITLQAKIDTKSCGVMSHAYVASACNGDSYYKHTNIAAPSFIVLGAPKTVHFRNPFACSLSALSFSPMSMNTSATYNFNLVIKNNGDSVNITNIALVAGSLFSNLVVGVPTLPYTLGAGAQQSFSGSVKAPSTPGMHTLTLNINSVSTAPNCTGTTANCNLQASFTINVTTPPSLNPDYVPLLSAPLQVQVSTQFTANVTTKNIGNAAAGVSTITRLRFRNIVNNIGVAPLAPQGTQNDSRNFACPSTPGLYELNATADATGVLTEANENNNFASMMVNCTSAPPAQKPDYISIIVAPDNAAVGTTFNINVNTANIGNAPAIAFSTTQFNVTGQPPLLFSVPPLGVPNGFVTNTTTATCPNYPTTIILRSFADLYNQTGESNRLNNADTETVNCYIPSNAPNYVPNITAPSVVFVGYPFSANFTTKNIGTVAATSSSTTRAGFQTSIPPSTFDFTVPALQPNGQQTDSHSFICSGAGNKILNQTVDYFGNIAESNENDNFASKTVACYPVPNNCTLSFWNHAATFAQNDWAQVRASCFSGVNPTACPPFFWQQNAVGGSMSPQNTPSAFQPHSTLSLSSAPIPQLNKKVSATSTLPSINLYCELLFNVNDGSSIGPDYTVTSITSNPHPALIDDVVHFTVKVKNIGNVNATNDSTSEAVFSSGCTPITSVYKLPPINAGESNLNSDLKCQCNAPGQQSITVTANPPPHAQWETDFDNNDLTYTFQCQADVQLTCAYFI